MGQDFFVTVRLEKPLSADMVSRLLFARKTSVKGCERSEKKKRALLKLSTLKRLLS